MKDVKIGNTSFNTKSLKACSSLKEAQEKFKSINKEVVKQAYEEAKKRKE